MFLVYILVVIQFFINIIITSITQGRLLVMVKLTMKVGDKINKAYDEDNTNQHLNSKVDANNGMEKYKHTNVINRIYVKNNVKLV